MGFKTNNQKKKQNKSAVNLVKRTKSSTSHIYLKDQSYSAVFVRIHVSEKTHLLTFMSYTKYNQKLTFRSNRLQLPITYDYLITSFNTTGSLGGNDSTERETGRNKDRRTESV